MKNKLNILFLFLAIISCSKNAFENAPSVAVIGEITNNGVDVLLSKALSSSGKYEFSGDNSSFFVNDADVFLYEDDTKILTLSFIGRGLYSFQNSVWRAKNGKKYKIIAIVPEYGTIESELVEFPENVQINNFSYLIQPNDSNNNPDKFPQVNIKMEVKPNQIIKSSFYEVAYNAERADGMKLYNLFNLPTDNLELNEKKAADCGRLYGERSVFFTNDCLINNNFHDVVRMDGSNFLITDLINSAPVTKMNLKVSSISESYHKYLISNYRQDGLDERFQEIPPSYTNIKNGIGYFYAKNENKEVFTIKR